MSGTAPQTATARSRRLPDRLQVTACVEDSERLSPKMRRITLRPAVSDLDWTPGQHVQVEYAARPGLLDHGDGLGSRWARQAVPGDEVLITRPQGDFTVRRPAAYHLFAGEETASAYGQCCGTTPASPRTQ